jgi:hypothetical protein
VSRLRPTEPRAITEKLALYWNDGVPRYQMTPTQYLGLHPEDYVCRMLDEHWTRLSRHRRRLVRRWLKDYRVLAVAQGPAVYVKGEMPDWIPEDSRVSRVVRVVVEETKGDLE